MKLSIRVRAEDQGGFLAWCPALPGCNARGQTRQEAIRKLELAIMGYLASLNASPPANLEPYLTVA